MTLTDSEITNYKAALKMQVYELNELLKKNQNAVLQFILPSGKQIPAHFHVTEVGRVEKSFVDCGGTVRGSTVCSLQLWTANDVEHRLHIDKLTKIMSMAESILRSTDIPVEVEYGEEVASSYSIGHSLSAFGTLQFYLVGKKTDCLSKDKCGINVDGESSNCC